MSTQIKTQIASGDNTNDSEYFRDLIRRDQEQNAKFRALKQAIQDGLDSGVSDKTVRQIMKEVEARLSRSLDIGATHRVFS